MHDIFFYSWCFIYQCNCLRDAYFMKNILKNLTCKWACVNNFKQFGHWRTLFPSFKYTYISFEWSLHSYCWKEFDETILFKSHKRLKFYIILSVLDVLIMYQTIHSFSNKGKSLPTKLPNVSWVTVKKIMFQVLHLMCILNFNV